MDLFQHRYHRLNKFLLKLSGIWPYQSFRVRVFCIIIILIISSVLIPQVTAIVKHRHDRDFVVECALPLIYSWLCLTKYLTSTLNSREMLKLLNHMTTDWDTWGQDCDVDILHKYAEKGRTMVLFYTVTVFITCIVFISQPVIPKIIDFWLKNGTELGQFPVPVDYIYIDMQKYYFYVIMHCTICAFVGTVMGIVSDCLFMVYVQHSCGLFAILRFAECIDGTYTWCFFSLASLNMILISIEGVQIVERTNELEITIKFTFCIAMALIHLYIESYMGQIVIDHSISIRNYIIDSEWYTLPLKSQKLLQLMIMRCGIPCKLTIGKLGIVSVETFCMILKTSLSYFTLLRSV